VTLDDADRAETRRQAAQSAFAIGQLDRAQEHLRAALSWHESRGDTQRAAEVAAALGNVLFQASRVDQAMDLMTRALEQLPTEASSTSIQLHGQLARGHLFRDHPELALEQVSRGLEAAEQLGRRTATLQLLITKSWALSSLRRPRESTALLLGAMRMADDEGELSPRLRARFNLSGYLVVDNPFWAMEIAEEGIALSQQFGFTLTATNMAGNAATIALLMGDLDRVLALEESVTEVNNPIGMSIHGYAAAAIALRGDADEARRRMTGVHAGHAGTSSAQDLSTIGYQESLIAFAEGNLNEARRTARETRDAYFGADGPLAGVLAARLSLLLRDAAGAHADRDRLAVNRIFGAWLNRAVDEVDAGILALEGRTAEAAAAYRRVIDDWRDTNLKFDLALTLLERARLLPEDDEAVAGRDEAAQIFAPIGATGLLERIEAALPPLEPARAAARRSPTPRSADGAATRR